MKKILSIIFPTLLFLFLTVLTQIGGIIYLLSKWLAPKWQRNFKLKTTLAFVLLYGIATFFVVPFLAPLLGREKVIHTETIRPTNYMTVVLNRNYVRPALNDVLQQMEKDLKNSGVDIRYLDANFPFINGFPLLPHLSHKDGKKIDLSLIYETKTGILTDQQRSRSGYGHFEPPKAGEKDQIKHCLDNGYWQYDYPKYLTLGSINPELIFSERGTQKLIKTVLQQSQIGKLFVEPHLQDRLGLRHKRIRYHGCRAVRHDDHIHIQLK